MNIIESLIGSAVFSFALLIAGVVMIIFLIAAFTGLCKTASDIYNNQLDIENELKEIKELLKEKNTAITVHERQRK